MNTSIHHSDEICKRLEAKKLTETISAYAMEYIMGTSNNQVKIRNGNRDNKNRR